MKLIFHKKFLESYDRDPAAEEGRLDKAFKLLCSKYPFVEPLPASKDDILLVHTKDYVDQVSRFEDVYRMALLAAGGAVLAARTALTGRPLPLSDLQAIMPARISSGVFAGLTILP